MNKICTEPITFTDYDDKKVAIDRGTIVTMPIYSIHMDSQYYPDPEKFDPERFSAENGGMKTYKDRGLFLAFGDGPRACVGMYSTL